MGRPHMCENACTWPGTDYTSWMLRVLTERHLLLQTRRVFGHRRCVLIKCAYADRDPNRWM